jgi:hypothetical protein
MNLYLLEICHDHSQYRIVKNLKVLWFLFEEIEDLLIVDLKVTNWQFDLIQITYLPAEIVQWEFNQTWLPILFCLLAKHSKAFSSPSDAIGEYCRVYAWEEGIKERLHCLLEDIVILDFFVEYLIELEQRLAGIRLSNC